MNNVHNTVIHVIENISTSAAVTANTSTTNVEGGIQIPIEGIELQIFDKVDSWEVILPFVLSLYAFQLNIYISIKHLVYQNKPR